MRARVVVVVVTALGLAACQQDVERAPAGRRNLRALDLVPRIDGVSIVKTQTRGHTAPDGSDGPIVRWVTRRGLSLARPETFRAIVSRVERTLTQAGWQVPVGSGGYMSHARRAGPCLSAVPVNDEPRPNQEIPLASVTMCEQPGEAARGLVLVVTDC